MSADKPYDLEERTFQFAKNVRLLMKKVKRTIGNLEDGKQLIRSSGSAGANYIEANDCLGIKDFRMRVRISKKESKESRYWLRLIDSNGDAEVEKQRAELEQEAGELMKIFAAILKNSGK